MYWAGTRTRVALVPWKSLVMNQRSRRSDFRGFRVTLRAFACQVSWRQDSREVGDALLIGHRPLKVALVDEAMKTGLVLGRPSSQPSFGCSGFRCATDG